MCRVAEGRIVEQWDIDDRLDIDDRRPGVVIGALDASTAAAFGAAGLVSALALPTMALSVLQSRSTAAADVSPPEREMIVA